MKLYIGYSSFCVILELRKDIPKVNNAHNPFMLERRFSYETSFCHPAGVRNGLCLCRLLLLK